jgi:hypothetical protein
MLIQVYVYHPLCTCCDSYSLRLVCSFLFSTRVSSSSKYSSLGILRVDIVSFSSARQGRGVYRLALAVMNGLTALSESILGHECLTANTVPSLEHLNDSVMQCPSEPGHIPRICAQSLRTSSPRVCKYLDTVSS